MPWKAMEAHRAPRDMHSKISLSVLFGVGGLIVSLRRGGQLGGSYWPHQDRSKENLR